MGLEAESEDRDTNEEHGDDSHPLIIIKLIGDFFFMPYAQQRSPIRTYFISQYYVLF